MGFGLMETLCRLMGVMDCLSLGLSLFLFRRWCLYRGWRLFLHLLMGRVWSGRRGNLGRKKKNKKEKKMGRAW